MTVHLEPEKYLERVVEVKFLDHVTSGEAEQELVMCTAWGRLVHDDWQKIRLRTWESEDDEDPNADAEFYTIIRAAVMSIRPLTYEEK